MVSEELYLELYSIALASFACENKRIGKAKKNNEKKILI